MRDDGFDRPRYCMQSNGGLATFAVAAAAPLSLVESDPCGGVAGAARNGQPVLRPDYKLECSRLKAGYPAQTPVVDIVEIGAGGGSIARVEKNGDLAVGPESVGAEPGPACYARGSAEPTVTDAKLITGVIDPASSARPMAARPPSPRWRCG